MGFDPLSMLTSAFTGGLSFFGQQQSTAQQIAAQQAMQRESEQFNADEAQKNRDFQEQMSNTQYTRAAADMKNAGLNPILAAGSSAGNLSGSAASIGTPTAPAIPNKLGNAVSTALSTMQLKAALDNMTEQNKNISADTDLKTAQQIKTDMEKGLVQAQQGATNAEARLRKTVADTMAGDVVKGRTDAKIMNTPAWTAARTLGLFGHEANSATSAANNIIPGVRTFNQLWKDRVDRGF